MISASVGYAMLRIVCVCRTLARLYKGRHVERVAQASGSGANFMVNFEYAMTNKEVRTSSKFFHTASL